jgi:hypothetical protein
MRRQCRMSMIHLRLEHNNLGASVDELEQLVNLGYGELRPSDLPADAEIQERVHCHHWGDSHPHLYELLRKELVYKLHYSGYSLGGQSRQERLSSCAQTDICVAVHVRYGDLRLDHLLRYCKADNSMIYVE